MIGRDNASDAFGLWMIYERNLKRALGSHEVTTKIGEGGMGEVYRVRDTKLDRDVALKVLPQAFTDDPD